MKMYKLLIASIGLLFFFSCSSAQQEQAAKGTAKIEDIDIQTFKAKMTEPDVVVLDVRTPKEIRKGKIENAVEINIRGAAFETEIAKLDKSKTYLVYCAAGGRSKRACQQMEKVGFAQLYNLEGGYKKWKAEGN